MTKTTLNCWAVILTLSACASGIAQDVVFPRDARYVVVTSAPYYAKADGVSDDTQALLNAIRNNIGYKPGTRTLYFPRGTYLVTNTLAWKNIFGEWTAYLVLQGESMTGTIIKLKNNCAGYASTNTPKAVLFTAAPSNYSYYAVHPTGGQYGLGNTAFANSIFNMTIDTGSGNPGAIGVDYLANNQGTLADVVIKSGDGAGVAGLGLWRDSQGPCLIKNVSIDGFDVGILATSYAILDTLEHIALCGQRVCGIQHSGMVLALRDVQSSNSVPVLRQTGTAALASVCNGVFRGGASNAVAIESTAGLYLYNIAATGYQAALATNGVIAPGLAVTQFSSSPALRLFDGSPATPQLAVAETPAAWEPDLTLWTNVAAFGASPSDSLDDTRAIQAALNSGAQVVYLPAPSSGSGQYYVTNTLRIGGAVRILEGCFSTLLPSTSFTTNGGPWPVLRIENGQWPTVTVRRFFIERQAMLGQLEPVSIEHAATSALVVAHCIVSSYRNRRGVGSLFFEDVSAHTLKSEFYFEHPQTVWARQFDPEDPIATKVINNGGALWVLGFKTERPTTVLLNAGSGRAEIFGASNLAQWPTPADVALYSDFDAAQLLSFAHISYGGDKYYKTLLDETQGAMHRELRNTQAPSNGGGGNLCPLVLGGPATSAVPAVTVCVHAPVPQAYEGGATGMFAFMRYGPLTGALTAAYAVTGSALAEYDYAALAGQCTFAPGQDTVWVPVVPVNDTRTEWCESVVVSLAPAAGYQRGYPPAATVMLIDNDGGSAPIPTSGLVLRLSAGGHLQLDADGRVAQWIDASGAGNTAWLPPAQRRPRWLRAGINTAPALEFDGDLLLLPSGTSLQQSGPYPRKTLLIGLQTGANVVNRQMIFEEGGDTRGLNMYLETNQLYCSVWESWGTATVKTNIMAQTPYVAELSFDQPSGTLTLYLDGVLAGQTTVGGTLASHGDQSAIGTIMSTSRCYDGVKRGYGDLYFYGRIADILSYNAVLTTVERSAVTQYLLARLAPPVFSRAETWQADAPGTQLDALSNWLLISGPASAGVVTSNGGSRVLALVQPSNAAPVRIRQRLAEQFPDVTMIAVSAHYANGASTLGMFDNVQSQCGFRVQTDGLAGQLQVLREPDELVLYSAPCTTNGGVRDVRLLTDIERRTSATLFSVSVSIDRANVLDAVPFAVNAAFTESRVELGCATGTVLIGSTTWTAVPEPLLQLPLLGVLHLFLRARLG